MVSGNQKAWMGVLSALVGVAVGAEVIDAEQGASLTNLAGAFIVAVLGFAGVWLKANKS